MKKILLCYALGFVCLYNIAQADIRVKNESPTKVTVTILARQQLTHYIEAAPQETTTSSIIPPTYEYVIYASTERANYRNVITEIEMRAGGTITLKSDETCVFTNLSGKETLLHSIRKPGAPRPVSLPLEEGSGYGTSVGTGEGTSPGSGEASSPRSPETTRQHLSPVSSPVSAPPSPASSPVPGGVPRVESSHEEAHTPPPPPPQPPKRVRIHLIK